MLFSFFFASYEGVRLVQGNVVNAQVPTAAMKAGNLSASPTNIYDPLSGAGNGTGRTPFADKLIPANRIDPGVKAMLETGAWPNPNQDGSGAFGLSRNFQCLGCQGNSGARRDQIDGKFNWNPNSKRSTYVRAGYNKDDWYNPVIFGLLGGPVVSPTNISAGVGAAKVWNNTVSASYIFSPSLLLDAFYGYSRIDMYSKQPNQEQNLGYTLLKIPGLDTSGLSRRKQLEYGGLPLMAIDAFTSLGRRTPSSRRSIAIRRRTSPLPVHLRAGDSDPEQLLVFGILAAGDSGDSGSRSVLGFDSGSQ